MTTNQWNDRAAIWLADMDMTEDEASDYAQESVEEEGKCEALDGCWIEADGYCPHGFPSWALYLGLV